MTQGRRVEDRDLRPRGGVFLAFEGVEGSGKSTQAQRLTEHLRAAGVDVVLAREPGSTPVGERIRGIVLDARELEVGGRTELFLMLAARAAFVEQVVTPALENGQVVIADRFELSTLAYQGAGRGLPIDEVVAANRFATRGISPDLTLLLDVPTEEGVRRQAEAGKIRDRLESETRDFHQRVARGYDELAGQVTSLARVDASGSADDVHRRILAVLEGRFPETFPPGGVIS